MSGVQKFSIFAFFGYFFDFQFSIFAKNVQKFNKLFKMNFSIGYSDAQNLSC